MSDQVSAFVRMLTSALGGNFPIRFAIGVSLGTFLKMLSHTAAISWPDLATLHALDEFAVYWFVVVVTPLAFIPIVFNRYGVPEQALHQLNIIDALAERGQFSAAQRRMIFHSMANKYVQALDPKLEKPHSLEKLFEETTKEVGPGATP